MGVVPCHIGVALGIDNTAAATLKAGEDMSQCPAHRPLLHHQSTRSTNFLRMEQDGLKHTQYCTTEATWTNIQWSSVRYLHAVNNNINSQLCPDR